MRGALARRAEASWSSRSGISGSPALAALAALGGAWRAPCGLRERAALILSAPCTCAGGGEGGGGGEGAVVAAAATHAVAAASVVKVPIIGVDGERPSWWHDCGRAPSARESG